MLFANNIVWVEENRKKVNQWLNLWRLTLEEKGLKIIRSKTEYIKYEFDEREQEVKMSSGMTGEDEVKEIESFKYLGFLYTRTGVLTRMWKIGLGMGRSSGEKHLIYCVIRKFQWSKKVCSIRV